MDPVSHKQYHSDEFDPKDLLNTYCTPDVDRTLFEEVIVFPLKTLQRLLSSGKIVGTTLLDFSTAPNISHLLPMCDYFSDIFLLETNDLCMRHAEKWWKGEEEDFDWSHLAEYFTELEGDKKKWIEKEKTLKTKIKNVIKCDLSKTNPTDPFILPKAECMMCFYMIGHISKDKEAYRENIKKLSSFLNVGGHLFITGSFNVKCFTTREHKFHTLPFDEEFFKKALEDGGFTIEFVEKRDCSVVSGIAKYDHLFLACAIKVREV